MAKGDYIQERLIDLAVNLIVLNKNLPTSSIGAHIGTQVVRSGTSAAVNYAEARGAESRRDFIHKLKVVVKELNETWVWLQIVRRAELVDERALLVLESNSVMLGKVINASIRTARQRLNSTPRTGSTTQ